MNRETNKIDFDDDLELVKAAMKVLPLHGLNRAGQMLPGYKSEICDANDVNDAMFFYNSLNTNQQDDLHRLRVIQLVVADDLLTKWLKRYQRRILDKD